MNAFGRRVPDFGVCFDERLDLTRRQLDASIAKRGQRFTRLADERASQFFVGDDLTD
jgi:hypothetical protein